MIQINNLSKQFGKNILFNDLTLNIKANQITALVGSSGCGKTTILNLIGMLDVEYKGDILINNQSITKISPAKKMNLIRNKINYLFQDYALIESKSVEYNLNLALEYTKLSKNDKKKAIKSALEKVGLSGINNKIVYMLSGGEQQRVALARVILKPGDIILADEPTGNLDSENATIVFDLLLKLKDEGKTVVIVTHDNNIANKCDEIIKIK